VDIGAYQHDCSDYWIPGFQKAHASKPIPVDGAKNAKANSSLIWLGGFRGKGYEIYIGSDRKSVETAGPDSRQFRGRQMDNIFTSERIPSGATVYWRVDTVTDSGTVAGPVWSFTRKH
jgi:hypothetical protein